MADKGWYHDEKYVNDWFRDTAGCELMLTQATVDGGEGWYWEAVSLPDKTALTGLVVGDLARAKRVAELACGPLKELVANLEAGPAKFAVGQQVRKFTGDYQLAGEVRAVFTTRAGKVRYVVEHQPGFLHIYGEANLEECRPTVTGE